MNVLDLFSGIGGFSLGLERAGMRTVAFVEIDSYCRAVLRKHWPGVPIFEDVRTLDAAALADASQLHINGGNGERGESGPQIPQSGNGSGQKPISLICGGFPCQPWSVAGQRRGKEDHRDLWPEMLRLVGEFRPRWVLGENVPGLDDQRYMALDGCLSDLEALSYEAQAFEIPACAVDAPHRRQRLWIMAHANGTWQSQPTGRDRDQRRRLVDCCEDMAESGGTEPSDGDGRALWAGTKAGDVERCNRWLPEPDVGRVANGVPRRVDRLRSLGNAVVPQVVEVIGRAIMRAQNATGPIPFDRNRAS